MMSARPIAFFDFDGTLTKGDSLLPFLRFVRGTSRFLSDLVITSPWLAAYAAGLLRNDRAKEALLKQALFGMQLQELRELGAAFAEKKIPTMLRADMLSRLRDHQKEGHCCVLVSASLDVYLEPWAKELQFEDCLASSLEIDELGAVTGKLKGANCFGDEKVRRISAFLDGVTSPPCTYAYGDSRGDITMLSMVDHGYWVK